MGYFWIYYLAVLCLFSLSVFLITLSPSVTAVKRLKLAKSSLLINWLFVLFSIVSLSLLVYLFYILKVQLEIMT
ncbi:hypothetical protein I6N95_15650 [Vagococcus sp. BWB3-3]|uniref:Uncharacterized protein n=1 Tax=Vagococcus allomyrinae TaxID=2794353 RepID=A0A940PEE3_9ENTE|nr:hypothetical protein [Vagococcus allomyrinae]MBP1042453.1 hypothetical protein [Vagococcus allomyrinae]